MKKKIYDVMNKIYGISMTVAFFGGILPLIPFAIAMIIGGETGEKIALFLYNLLEYRKKLNGYEEEEKEEKAEKKEKAGKAPDPEKEKIAEGCPKYE